MTSLQKFHNISDSLVDAVKAVVEESKPGEKPKRSPGFNMYGEYGREAGRKNEKARKIVDDLYLQALRDKRKKESEGMNEEVLDEAVTVYTHRETGEEGAKKQAEILKSNGHTVHKIGVRTPVEGHPIHTIYYTTSDKKKLKHSFSDKSEQDKNDPRISKEANSTSWIQTAKPHDKEHFKKPLKEAVSANKREQSAVPHRTREQKKLADLRKQANKQIPVSEEVSHWKVHAKIGTKTGWVKDVDGKVKVFTSTEKANAHIDDLKKRIGPLAATAEFTHHPAIGKKSLDRKARLGEAQAAKDTLPRKPAKVVGREDAEIKMKIIDENVGEKHRISVTVSEPNHTMVTKRKERTEKFVRVSGNQTKPEAVEQAKKYYSRKGYKVHDANHVGMVTEAKIDFFTIAKHMFVKNLDTIKSKGCPSEGTVKKWCTESQFAKDLDPGQIYQHVQHIHKQLSGGVTA